MRQRRVEGAEHAGERRVDRAVQQGRHGRPQPVLLAHERETLGLYVTAHPLEGAEHLLRRHADRSIAALLADRPREGEVTVAGLITAGDRRVDKRGEPWAICTLEDLDASLEVLFSPGRTRRSGRGSPRTPPWPSPGA